MTILKGFADEKLNVVKMMISLLDRVENTVGKGENADYQHFLLFAQCFQKPSSLGSLKVGIVWQRVKTKPYCSCKIYSVFTQIPFIKRNPYFFIPHQTTTFIPYKTTNFGLIQIDNESK